VFPLRFYNFQPQIIVLLLIKSIKNADVF